MNRHMPFLVMTGCLSDLRIRAGSIALSKVWGGQLLEYSCNESPNSILNTLPNKKGLVRLIGDAAMAESGEGSWLEALGAWRQPTILLVEPLPSGEIPGIAVAYVALCKELRVPLLGILQFGGQWDCNLRRMDCLPWCGWIPENQLLTIEKSDQLQGNNFISNDDIFLQVVKANIQKRMSYLIN